MNYTELVDSIHSYTNRSTKVLPYPLVKTFIDFGMTSIYADLRVPPLESVSTMAAAISVSNELPIPDDAIEFIQLRILDSDGKVDNIYNARADIRSFYNDSMTKYDCYNYTREGNSLLVYPDVAIGDVHQLYYYHRLPTMYARYAVTNNNNIEGRLYSGVDADAVTALVVADDANAFTRDPDLTSKIVNSVSAADGLADAYYLGRIAPNWIRDEDEKTVLYATLVEAFTYLNDDEKLSKYAAMLGDRIHKLNTEAKLRAVRGGISQVHFAAPLL
jgi:hypothetical protein